jgi:F-box protein 9
MQLDDKVDKLYKAKHFPPSYFKAQKKTSATTPAPAPTIPNPQDSNPSNASATVPNPAHHSLHGLSPSLQALIHEFTTLSIQGEPPPTDLSPTPPCPIAAVPEEILVEILEHVAVRDIASFIRLAQVCKRLAYLVATEDRVWKRLAVGHEYGFAAMHYSWTCQVDGTPLGDDDLGGLMLGSDSDIEDQERSPTTPSPLALTPLLVPTTYPTHRTLFQRRPRIRFNGCYISTVNYTRTGQASPTSVTWSSPIHIVTYYRYIRFLRDGTCISLLTTSEPADVVPYLYVEHMHKHHGALASAAMKDALLGRWRLSGPEVPAVHDEGGGEKEGTVIIETAGAVPKYMYKMVLGLGTAGRGAKNNKLTWQGYWSYNRLTDDWGEFGLKNDRAFYWSRVKSYGMSWDERGRKGM